jgi:hypothetical protein
MLLSPQDWDLPDLDVAEPPDPSGLDDAHLRVIERFDEALDPAWRLLDETARRVAHAPPIPAGPLLLAMATDLSFSDETRAAARYASPAATVAALTARGVL